MPSARFLSFVLASLAAPLSSPTASPQDPGAAVSSLAPAGTPLESEIAEVTVYAGYASVRRTATVESAGAFVVQGLPFALDPESVRVRAAGGEVVSVEVRERYQAGVPDPRVEEQRARVRTFERELAALQDEGTVLAGMEEYVRRLLAVEARDQLTDAKEGRADPDSWERMFVYLQTKLGKLRTQQRELGWRIEAKNVELNDARLELGRFAPSGGVRLRDVHVELVATGGALGPVEVEYVVGNAGWTPYYDLRTRKDLKAVELAYRARVWQKTGEDWRDTTILLSTAQPRRGAQGPEPRPIWLSLFDPQQVARRGRAGAVSELKSLGYGADAEAPSDAPAMAFAQVSDEGLSVRFRLPRAETVESRDEPTTVLVGRSDLSITPEHYCVPAIDSTVWLRAKAKNTSAWTLLPGRASVYMGPDFLGHAQLGAVQVEQDFWLHLGPDPALVVERTKLEDMNEESGMFSSKATLVESWRISVENAGGLTPRADGAVDVIVQETLPRSTDERVVVSIDSVRPPLRTDERWKKEREEQGVLTWILRVPRGQKKVIDLTTEIAYPEALKLQRR